MPAGGDGTVIVSMALAQRPGVGGHAWVALQYLLGFRRLGYDVLFVDQCSDLTPRAARWVAGVMAHAGLDDSFAVLGGDGEGLGLTRAQVLRRARGGLILNVMGFLADEEIIGAAGMTVFVDIDPGFGQMWRELGLADIFEGHDRHVTIGENVGAPTCRVPTCGIDWVTTRPPVVLDHWPAQPARPHGSVTSVVSWRGPFGPVEYRGRMYGLRVHEFRRFFALPTMTGERFELALDIDRADGADQRSLEESGWSLVAPSAAAGDVAAYQRYVQGSKAELMVAKNLYVGTRGGWFSDRSACYLASGRPVIAQDTGWSDRLPCDEGLLVFSTLEEAAEAVARVDGSYDDHSRAARAVAEEHFESDIVLGRLLADLAER